MSSKRSSILSHSSDVVLESEVKCHIERHGSISDEADVIRMHALLERASSPAEGAQNIDFDVDSGDEDKRIVLNIGGTCMSSLVL